MIPKDKDRADLASFPALCGQFKRKIKNGTENFGINILCNIGKVSGCQNFKFPADIDHKDAVDIAEFGNTAQTNDLVSFFEKARGDTLCDGDFDLSHPCQIDIGDVKIWHCPAELFRDLIIFRDEDDIESRLGFEHMGRSVAASAYKSNAFASTSWAIWQPKSRIALFMDIISTFL